MNGLPENLYFWTLKQNITTMNRNVTKLLFVLLASTVMCGQLQAQFSTTFAKNVTPGQLNGLYYSLPQTMLKLDFVIRETVSEKGPYSDYADMYFGGVDYIDYDQVSYELLDVRMTQQAAPDPNATFFVSFTSGRGGSKPEFAVLPNGIIRGVGNNLDLSELPSVAEQPTCTPQTEQAAGFLMLNSSGKSNAQMAKEVADKIEEIRKSKYYLISGDVEMASNPETFRTMYEKLDELERQYTSLIVGKQTVKTVVQTIYVIPNKETPTQTVAKFSEIDGLTSGTSGVGNPIVVLTLPLNSTAAINAPSQSAIESMTYENKLVYRIPEVANIKVTCQGKTLVEERQTVNQLGVLLMAPMQNATLMFDTETGQIVNMKMQ